jgi:hypothetical protein
MVAAQGGLPAGAHLYLTQGVGRRVGVLRRALADVFSTFPPDRKDPIPRDDLTGVQISLHAFVMNLAGVFDNWAWAYVLRHDLLEAVGGRLNVGMFKRATQDALPEGLRAYLRSEEMSAWHDNYLKTYRDALAHRIPLYIPPAAWTDADKLEYERLEAEKVRLIGELRWQELDEVWSRQDRIGSACALFLHEAVVGGDSRPVYLHPQMICDGMTVVDFGRRFYEQWHMRT